MTAIDRHALQGLQTLRILNISHNAIQTIHSTLLHDLEELQIFDLSYNKIQNIHASAFEKLKNLRMLRLDANQLTHISSNLLNISSLEVLYLGKNALKILQSNIFASLPNLMHLTLNEINLTLIPEELFTPLTNLRILNLSGNQIAHLRMTMFDDLEKLKFLHISENKLVCDCRLLELRNWMAATMDIDWLMPAIPECNLHKIGNIKLTHLELEHFDNCTLKYFMTKRKRKTPPKQKVISVHKSKFAMPYDPKMGVYTAIVLSGMLVAFLLCVAYYKIKKRVIRRFRKWKTEHEQNKLQKEYYMKTSTSDNSDKFRATCRIETVSLGSDSILENGDLGSQEYCRGRRYRKTGMYIQETVV
jgi:hypothetical protein